MRNIIQVHRFKTSNIGDIYSSPERYFQWLKPLNKYDIWVDDLDFGDKYADSVLLLGGGGLIGNKDFEPMLNKLMNSKFQKRILWGAGHNTHNKLDIKKPSTLLKKFDLVGVRDWGLSDLLWVPCPSCLDSAFDQEYEIKHDYVIYEHKNYPIEIYEDNAPQRNNKGEVLSEVIEFLSSGETIITNTYHGAYWGTLLKRKVVIVNPFSNKFSGLKYRHIVSSVKDYKKNIKNANCYLNSLEECRKANVDFSRQVRILLENS